MWSIPHFIFGILFAFLPEMIGIPISTAFYAMLILALLWEVYEKFVDIKETILNSIFDIILPIVAYFLTREAISYYSVDHERATVLFIAFLIVYMFTNLSGWLAYRRRNREFMH